MRGWKRYVGGEGCSLGVAGVGSDWGGSGGLGVCETGETVEGVGVESTGKEGIAGSEWSHPCYEPYRDRDREQRDRISWHIPSSCVENDLGHR